MGLDLDNSYDNIFETASNNNYQGNVDSLGDNINGIGGGPMINMQDLINVRESYNKKLLDEASAENSSRKYNLFMMMGGDISNNNFESNDHQMKMFQQKVNNRNGSQ